jgi:hypothetical protein
LTYYYYLGLIDPTVETQRRLRNVVLPNGPLAWVAFDHALKNAVAAYFDVDEEPVGLPGILDSIGIMRCRIERDETHLWDEPGLSWARILLQDLQHGKSIGLAFIRCAKERRQELIERLGGARVQLDTTGPEDVALIMISLAESQDFAVLLQNNTPVGCSILAQLISTDITWGVRTRS